jgi:hypothetical protein
VRLALPILVGVLAGALHVMWADSPYAPGVLDVLGTIGLAIAMVGMMLWCAGAWLDTPDSPAVPPLDGEVRP